MRGKFRVLTGRGGVPHDGLCAGLALGFAAVDVLKFVASLVQSMDILLIFINEIYG